MNFFIIGGDERMGILAEILESNRHYVNLAAVGKHGFSQPHVCETLNSSNVCILPVPLTRDKLTLNAPMFSEKVNLNDVFCCHSNALFIGGGEPPANCCVVNYADVLSREDFNTGNAIPTAEGALTIALSSGKHTLYSSSCLVSGFGRIGKYLSKLLKNTGASVTVCARRQESREQAAFLGYSSSDFGINFGKFDFIFNTVPSVIWNYKTVKKICPNGFFIDLAKGADEQLKAQSFYINAPSLPARFYPYTAAGVYYDTIINILKEKGMIAYGS